jgi:hypothetical protein
MDQFTPHDEMTQDGVPPRISSALRMFLAATAGIFASVLMLAISPVPMRSSVLQPDSYPNGPGLVGLIHLVEHIYGSPYFVLSVVLVFTFLAVNRRDEKTAWIYAFLVGCSLPGILFHWVFHWN